MRGANAGMALLTAIACAHLVGCPWSYTKVGLAFVALGGAFAVVNLRLAWQKRATPAGALPARGDPQVPTQP